MVTSIKYHQVFSNLELDSGSVSVSEPEPEVAGMPGGVSGRRAPKDFLQL